MNARIAELLRPEAIAVLRAIESKPIAMVFQGECPPAYTKATSQEAAILDFTLVSRGLAESREERFWREPHDMMGWGIVYRPTALGRDVLKALS